MGLEIYIGQNERGWYVDVYDDTGYRALVANGKLADVNAALFLIDSLRGNQPVMYWHDTDPHYTMGSNRSLH